MSLGKKLGAVAAGVGAIVIYVVAGGVGKIVGREAINAYQYSDGRLQDMVEKEVGGTPYGKALKEAYPDEWGNYVAGMATSLKDRNATAEEVRAKAIQQSRLFMLPKMRFMAKAPDDAIVRAFSSEAILLRQLQKDDPALCAAYALVGVDASMKFSPEAMALMQDTVVDRIKAAKAGETAPMQRPEFGEDDIIALYDGMQRAGSTEAEITALFEGTIGSFPVEKQCAVSLSMFQALTGMPDKRAALIYATFNDAALEAQMGKS